MRLGSKPAQAPKPAPAPAAPETEPEMSDEEALYWAICSCIQAAPPAVRMQLATAFDDETDFDELDPACKIVLKGLVKEVWGDE